jgi:hypothetical protein
MVEIAQGSVSYTFKAGILIGILMIILTIIGSYLFSITLLPIIKIIWMLLKSNLNIK